MLLSARALLSYRLIARFQHLLGFLDPQREDVLKRRQARRMLEAPTERALGQPAQSHHRLYRCGLAIMLRDPLLATADDGVL
jgi:hypothetical protein